MTQPAIVCPPCQAFIPPEHVQWQALSATCPRCALVLALVGQISPPVPIEGYPERVILMVDVPEPPKHSLRIEHGMTSSHFELGRWYQLGSRITIDHAGLTLRGRLGGGCSLALSTVIGCVTIQVVSDSVGGGGLTDKYRDVSVSTRVSALTTDGYMTRLAEFDDWNTARYLAAELNRALQRHGSQPVSAYRG